MHFKILVAFAFTLHIYIYIYMYMNIYNIIFMYILDVQYFFLLFIKSKEETSTFAYCF